MTRIITDPSDMPVAAIGGVMVYVTASRLLNEGFNAFDFTFFVLFVLAVGLTLHKQFYEVKLIMEHSKQTQER